MPIEQDIFEQSPLEVLVGREVGGGAKDGRQVDGVDWGWRKRARNVSAGW